MIRACQLLEAGRVPAAAEALAAALDLARPELLRWPFVDTPPQARRLLRTHPELQDLGAWLNPSSGCTAARPAGTAPRRRPQEPQVVQDLSDREMEVLRYLAEMLSTAEIAATMFISVNTVRTHIRSILRKLAVSRRNQAVRQGARARAALTAVDLMRCGGGAAPHRHGSVMARTSDGRHENAGRPDPPVEVTEVG